MFKGTWKRKEDFNRHLPQNWWATAMMVLMVAHGTACHAASDPSGDGSAQKATESANFKPTTVLSTTTPSAPWAGPGKMEEAILAKDPRMMESFQKGLISGQLDNAARILAVSGLHGKTLSGAIVDAGLIYAMPAEYADPQATLSLFNQSEIDPTSAAFTYQSKAWSSPLKYDLGKAYLRWAADPSVQNNYQDGENLRLKLAEKVKLGISDPGNAAGQFISESNKLEEVSGISFMRQALMMSAMYAAAYGELPDNSASLLAYFDFRFLPESIVGGTLPCVVEVDATQRFIKFTFQTRLGSPYTEVSGLNLVGSPAQYELRSLPLADVEAAGGANFTHTLLDTTSPNAVE